MDAKSDLEMCIKELQKVNNMDKTRMLVIVEMGNVETREEILKALDFRDNIQRKLENKIRKLKESIDYPHNFKGQMVEDFEWVLEQIN